MPFLVLLRDVMIVITTTKWLAWCLVHCNHSMKVSCSCRYKVSEPLSRAKTKLSLRLCLPKDLQRSWGSEFSFPATGNHALSTGPQIRYFSTQFSPELSNKKFSLRAAWAENPKVKIEIPHFLTSIIRELTVPRDSKAMFLIHKDHIHSPLLTSLLSNAVFSTCDALGAVLGAHAMVNTHPHEFIT